MDFTALTLANPSAIDAENTILSGLAKIFVPSGTTTGIILPHPASPGETFNRTKKDVSTAMYGRKRKLKSLTTGVEFTRSFQSLGSNDYVLRALHSGGPALATALTAATPPAWTATTAIALGTYRKATATSAVFEATTAGTTGATEPTWPTTNGDTVTDGDVVWTKRAAAPAPGKIIIENRVATRGRMIDVYLNAEDADNLPAEIYVAPEIDLEGNGIPTGRDGENETTLAWTETVYAPTGYTLPSSVGSLGSNTVEGGIWIIDIPPAQLQATVNALITGA